MMNKEVIVEFKEVSFGYDTTKMIFKDIDLKIYGGETIAIVGANGAGKSTLLKLITGLVRPAKGIVYVDGYKVNNKNIRKVRKKVGYTFQDADNQLFMPTVYEDVAFSAKQEGKSNEEVSIIVNKALEQVDALHLIEKPSYNLSGGEKRAITIATALASNPNVLILDEPSVGLDPRARRNLIRLLFNLKETKIIATHDMDLALDLCDRIIVMYNGEIQGDDTPTEIFKDKELLCNNHLELPLRMQGCPICSRKGEQVESIIL